MGTTSIPSFFLWRRFTVDTFKTQLHTKKSPTLFHTNKRTNTVPKVPKISQPKRWSSDVHFFFNPLRLTKVLHTVQFFSLSLNDWKESTTYKILTSPKSLTGDTSLSVYFNENYKERYSNNPSLK